MNIERKGKTWYTEKIKTHMYRLDGVYTARLLKEIFLIH